MSLLYQRRTAHLVAATARKTPLHRQNPACSSRQGPTSQRLLSMPRQNCLGLMLLPARVAHIPCLLAALRQGRQVLLTYLWELLRPAANQNLLKVPQTISHRSRKRFIKVSTSSI